jgi:hypothetical protein
MAVGTRVHARDVDIPEPCHADWDAMRPADRGRFCGQCRKKVHDLSAMSERDAGRLLARVADGEDLCVSYLSTADGVIAFSPAVVPLSRLRRLLPVAGLALAAAACTPTEPQSLTSTVAVTVPVPETEATAEADVVAATAATPSVLTRPLQALPERVTAVDVDEDIPCDGSMSEPADPSEVVAAPLPVTPPVVRRTAGKPVMRHGGALRRPTFPK